MNDVMFAITDVMIEIDNNMLYVCFPFQCGSGGSV